MSGPVTTPKVLKTFDLLNSRNQQLLEPDRDGGYLFPTSRAQLDNPYKPSDFLQQAKKDIGRGEFARVRVAGAPVLLTQPRQQVQVKGKKNPREETDGELTARVLQGSDYNNDVDAFVTDMRMRLNQTFGDIYGPYIFARMNQGGFFYTIHRAMQYFSTADGFNIGTGSKTIFDFVKEPDGSLRVNILMDISKIADLSDPEHGAKNIAPQVPGDEYPENFPLIRLNASYKLSLDPTAQDGVKLSCQSASLEVMDERVLPLVEGMGPSTRVGALFGGVVNKFRDWRAERAAGSTAVAAAQAQSPADREPAGAAEAPPLPPRPPKPQPTIIVQPEPLLPGAVHTPTEPVAPVRSVDAAVAATVPLPRPTVSGVADDQIAPVAAVPAAPSKQPSQPTVSQPAAPVAAVSEPSFREKAGAFFSNLKQWMKDNPWKAAGVILLGVLFVAAIVTTVVFTAGAALPAWAVGLTAAGAGLVGGAGYAAGAGKFVSTFDDFGGGPSSSRDPAPVDGHAKHTARLGRGPEAGKVGHVPGVDNHRPEAGSEPRTVVSPAPSVPQAPTQQLDQQPVHRNTPGASARKH